MNRVTKAEREALLAAARRLRLELNDEGEVVGGFREVSAGLAAQQGVSQARAQGAVSRVVMDLRRRQRAERKQARREAWPPARRPSC